MRRIAPVLLAITALTVGCARIGQPTRVEQERTFPVTEGKLVRLDLGSLDAKVRVVESGDIHVRLSLEARASSSRAAHRWVERNSPVFEDSPNTLEIRRPGRHATFLFFGFVHTAGSVEVELPRTCRLEVSTSSGDVSIEGAVRPSEPVRVRTSSGDVLIDGGAGAAVIRTTSGDVRIDGGRLDLLDVETSSGDVRLRAGAEKATIETTSGDVHLLGLAGDLSADTSSGDVWATWKDLTPTASVHISTSSGDVVLRMPTAPPYRGELRTSSGDIRSSVEGTWDERRRDLRFSGGGPRLEVRTSSGDITILAS
jgi:Toastrack DUF4097